MNFHPPQTSVIMRTADRSLPDVLQKSRVTVVARLGERAAEGGIPERIARPASRSRFVLSTDQVVRFFETVSEPEGPRCADDGSGPEFEVHFSPFKGVILRYIWTFGQIFSTAFMNRSR